MNKVLLRIFSADGFNSTLVLYIGRDEKGYAYWEHLGSSYGFHQFRDAKGDWWYDPTTSNLDIYITEKNGTNTLVLRLAGVRHDFLPPRCDPDRTGKGVRFPDMRVEYSIGGSGTCDRTPPKKWVKAR